MEVVLILKNPLHNKWDHLIFPSEKRQATLAYPTEYRAVLSQSVSCGKFCPYISNHIPIGTSLVFRGDDNWALMCKLVYRESVQHWSPKFDAIVLCCLKRTWFSLLLASESRVHIARAGKRVTWNAELRWSFLLKCPNQSGNTACSKNGKTYLHFWVNFWSWALSQNIWKRTLVSKLKWWRSFGSSHILWSCSFAFAPATTLRLQITPVDLFGIFMSLENRLLHFNFQHSGGHTKNGKCSP